MAKDYKAHKEAQAEYSRQRTAAGQDIGGIPPIANVRRRTRTRKSLRLFCETYNPATFYNAWSADHLKAIARIEEAATLGAMYAFAMARGSGKSALSRHAALWALSHAHCRYVFVIGATGEKAEESLEVIKTVMRFGKEYAEDFPEISHAVIALKGSGRLAGGQTCGGDPTLVEWTKDRVVLPTVPVPPNWPKAWPRRADGKAPASGAVLATSGLTGEGIRGSTAVLSTGEMVRPDLVLLDDPQTADSARSPSQNRVREQLVSADILGMAGPNTPLAAVMPCTVIYPGDMVDNILDRSKHPLWRGERSGMLASMPKNMVAWDQYFEVYRRCAQKEPPDFTESNAYYVSHRAALDEGAEASWAERKYEDTVSAIQHAMNLYCKNPRSFMAEYQNQPEALDLGAVEEMDPRDIVRRLSAVPRGTVPRECSRLTAGVDVGGKLLFWCVVGWTDAFAGRVVDYGTVPGQARTYFRADDARPSLEDAFAGFDETARVYAGLRAAADAAVGRAYPREGGGELRVERCLVDAGWQAETVHQFCRQHPLAALLTPSKGFGITAAGNPMANWTKRPGDVCGVDWKVVPNTEGGRGRLCVFDANAWKSFAAGRLLTPDGGAGGMTLFGSDGRAHEMFADHLCAEYRVRTEGRGRKVDEWKVRPERADNHWWDCLVMATVAASVLGLRWDAGAPVGDPRHPRPERKKVRLSDLFAQKAGGRR